MQKEQRLAIRGEVVKWTYVVNDTGEDFFVEIRYIRDPWRDEYDATLWHRYAEERWSFDFVSDDFNEVYDYVMENLDEEIEKYSDVFADKMKGERK